MTTTSSWSRRPAALWGLTLWDVTFPAELHWTCWGEQSERGRFISGHGNFRKETWYLCLDKRNQTALPAEKHRSSWKWFAGLCVNILASERSRFGTFCCLHANGCRDDNGAGVNMILTACLRQTVQLTSCRSVHSSETSNAAFVSLALLHDHTQAWLYGSGGQRSTTWSASTALQH